MRQIKKSVSLLIAITLLLFIVNPNGVHAIAESKAFFTYGAGLSQEQLKETERLLGIDGRNVERVLVDKETYNKYTGLDTSDSSLYSSAVIVEKEKGSGVNIYINTPGNITKIEDHQYMNAALTSGITDSDIIVASPVKVTGESALAGLYKALDQSGVKVNEEAAKIANEELTMTKDIVDNNKENVEFDSEELSLALAEIKDKIAETEDKKSLTKSNIMDIINETLDKREIELKEKDKERIASWLNKFKDLDVDWKALGGQLKGLGEKVAEKTGDLYDWGKESGFFTRVWEAIKAFFTKLFE